MRGIHTTKERGILQRVTMIVLTFVLVAGYPFMAMADPQEPITTPPPETTTQTPPEAPSQTPTETPPETTSPAPEKPKLTYTFNEATGHWDSEEWQFNPETNRYEKPPAPKVITPEVKDTSSGEVDKNIDTNVQITNEMISDALSGNASVTGNTLGGNATSGNAQVAANILNSVNSSITSGSNAKVSQFTQDYYGDMQGDIMLTPLLLKAMLEAQVANINGTNGVPTTVNADTNLGMNNNVTLNATSGNAGVTNNTTGGNATTGDATAMANVTNILNSMISAQDSFIGTINIYGSLDGDILLAPDFIPQMIASNGGSEGDLKVNSQDTQTIVNNISAVAESGAASVLGNTSGGSATSGSADSNVVIFNLSGHEIVAANSMLVFINVLGKWVGVIVDAPQGATAAMLADGVTENKYDPDLTVNSKSTQGITNTIAVNAETGDALVANNTTGGNATTGDAKTQVNVANVMNSQVNLSGWFQLLFINIAGDWCGSFGINTSCGNIPPIVQVIPEATSNPPAEAPVVNTSVRYRVIDTRSYSQPVTPVDTEGMIPPIEEAEDLAEFSSKNTLGAATAQPASQDDYRLLIIAGSILVVGGAVIGLKRLFS